MTLPGTYNSFMSQNAGIQYMGNTGRYAADGNKTLDVSTIAQNGDYLLVTYTLARRTSITVVVSCTVATTSLFRYNDGSTNWSFGAYGGFYNGTNPVFSHDSNGSYILCCHVFRGVNASTPIDGSITLSNENPSNGVPIPLLGVTTSTTNTFPLWYVSGVEDTSTGNLYDTWSNTSLSNDQEMMDYSTSLWDGAVMAMYGGVYSFVGTTSTTSVTPRHGTSSWRCARFALRSA